MRRGSASIGSANRMRVGAGAMRALYRQHLPAFLDRYGARLDPDERAIIEAVGRSSGAPFQTLQSPFSLIHIDYRLDNLLIDERASPPKISVVDWQSITLGSPLGDVAYFLGAGLVPEERRRAEADIVRAYHTRAGCGRYRRLSMGSVLGRLSARRVRRIFRHGHRVDDRAADAARRRDVHDDGAQTQPTRDRRRCARVPRLTATRLYAQFPADDRHCPTAEGRLCSADPRSFRRRRGLLPSRAYDRSEVRAGALSGRTRRDRAEGPQDGRQRVRLRYTTAE